MIKSFKIRLYPTKEQEQLMWQHIGACRFIYNYMLKQQQKLYESGEKHLSHFGMINMLKPLKNDGEHNWLYEVSNTSLQRVCGDLNEAYQGFFKKRTGFPKFKSKKRSKQSFPIDAVKLWFDILLQGIIGSLIITFFEYVIGELFLNGVLPVMWDYSNVFLNYKGIICLPFSLVWVVLSIVAVVIADAINYYLLDDEEVVPYYKLFGKTIFKFKSK